VERGTRVRALIRHDRMAVRGPAPNGLAFADGAADEFDAIVWTTEFAPSYEFLHVPGRPRRGRATAAPGGSSVSR
jgi:hypothetical protein